MSDQRWLRSVLGRLEHLIPLPTTELGVVLVTGANGSIGKALADEIEKAGIATRVIRTDIDTLDVRDWPVVLGQMRILNPDVVFHLAGAKHAPEGEHDPWEVTHTNVYGTLGVLHSAAQVNAKVVMASTCKACDPETAYGASKLIAERMTLNMGGSVARYYNVVQSSGNVFEIWRNAAPGTALEYTPCTRRFITLQEAVRLTLACATLDPGRYAIAGTAPRTMQDIAMALYPLREWRVVSPRRGDRLVEPELAACERGFLMGGSIKRITSPHDPVPATEREDSA